MQTIQLKASVDDNGILQIQLPDHPGEELEILSEKWVEHPVLKGRLCGTIKLVTDPPATMETESLTSKLAESATAQKNR
ncbi:hypothetical protein [Roseofilum capinflatum]|uniref:Uncharacterized protein n=1 Tax=Roseofilum capinflatum BLCC-M114 TaxID=3022440 RepID=A0ABT7B566_9CYAN|nr:hypothetical protein [Roseofilum capinflatum]MDJ1174318.1 hypothetical protein [Roseofilum capinflatum BLCC-M114]